MWYQLVLVVYLAVYNAKAQTLGGYCRTPLNEGAKCISVYECETLLPLIRSTTRTAAETTFLKSSRCGFDSARIPYVCCGINSFKTTTDDGLDTPFSPNSLIPSRPKCGFQWSDRIFSGEATALDEFPWMAVLQYLKPSGEKRIACAGSLINSRYVLTAAHCVIGDVLQNVGELINVRLGEYDTSSPGRDCVTLKSIKFCNKEEVNLGVEQVIPHPSYIGAYNRLHDIALVRLSRDVQFSEFVQPVCLPLPNEKSAPGEKLIVAGWGKTEKGMHSNVKLKLQIPVKSKTQCDNAFSSLRVQIADSQICAGGDTEKDSCKGDSGGPLMRITPTDNTVWMIEGLVSFGDKHCGIAGYPGVYTRIAKYVPWIHKNVRA